MLRFFRRRTSKPDALTLHQSRWSATHRHKKGGLYRVICEGIAEADRSPVVIYDDAEGTVWVRARDEFFDGRFTALDTRAEH